jgi:hypothetical protein
MGAVIDDIGPSQGESRVATDFVSSPEAAKLDAEQRTRSELVLELFGWAASRRFLPGRAVQTGRRDRGVRSWARTSGFVPMPHPS